MKFYKFLNEIKYEKKRSKALSEEECFNYLSKNCKQSIKQTLDGNIIYRGSKFKGDYLLTIPTGNRKSAHTENYYTLIINNDPSWKEYPKREIICTFDYRNAKNYGNSYAVFPIDNSKIGICPENDIWYSFIKINKMFSYLGNFNNSLKDFLIYNKLPIKYDNFNDFKKTLMSIKKEKDEYNRLQTYFKESKFENLYDYIVDLLDPKKNYFQISNIKNFESNENSEVWVDKPCILISLNKDVINREKLKGLL